MKRRIHTFWYEDEGQDLVEYSLILAFVVLAGAAAFIGMAGTSSGLWSTVNSRLGAANNAGT